MGFLSPIRRPHLFRREANDENQNAGISVLPSDATLPDDSFDQYFFLFPLIGL